LIFSTALSLGMVVAAQENIKSGGRMKEGRREM
jgi:hypothetical protein